ncbi:TraM recognition domain-containing protein [Pseudophaeobacter sp.]|uniref:type IV secretory system conjugative DNA transfer family protein n=4 Tax=Paracoccaceae TaxID=31989 RepID=UPI003296A115
MLLSANGGGKTTRGAMVWAISLIASHPGDALLISDGKDGELSAQLVPMLAKMGVKVAVIDDMRVRPELAEHRIALNSFGATALARAEHEGNVIYASESITHALIPEPKDDAKNKYFRAWPRSLVEFAHLVMLSRKPETATPGAAALMLSDPDLLITYAEIEARDEGGSPFLRALARNILGMQGHEHWPQHLEEAQRSLRTYAPGARLHEAGNGATLNHADLIRQGYVTFLVGPQAYMDRLGSYYALHIQSFFQALYGGAGKLRLIADEFSNTPLSTLAQSETTIRAYGGEVHKIAQSRSEIIRKFGEQENRTLEENAIVKQFFGFSSFDEAERVSKAMGEQHAVASSLGSDGDGMKTNTNLSLIKQRWMSAAELMAMPQDQQLIHIKGVGFVMARTVSQSQLSPYCDLLADNPLEGGRLPSDPLIKLPLPEAQT